MFNRLKQAEGYYLVYGVLIGDIIHDTDHISLWGLKKWQLTNIHVQGLLNCWTVFQLNLNSVPDSDFFKFYNDVLL